MKKMKIIIIGDIHGRDTWKDIVRKHPDADKIIFVGDYFDSFDISGVIQLHNFKEILAMKLEYPNKIVLLCGNHDYHYLTGTIGAQYSGFQMGMLWDFAHILDPLIREETLQVAFQIDNFLITHAGVTKTWCENNNIEMDHVCNYLNYMFLRNLRPFEKCGTNFSGDTVTEGPMWVRPNSLRKDKIDGFTQIVGHTWSDGIEYEDDVITIDTLMDGKYLELNISEGEEAIIKFNDLNE